MNLTQHPLSAAWPSMSEQDMDSLRVSIKKQGLLNPIIVYRGQVLDGWHRKLICEELGVKYVPKAYRGKDPAGDVIAWNDARRHLTTGQRVHARVLSKQWVDAHGGSSGTPPSKQEISKETKASRSEVQRSRKVAKNGTEKLNAAVVAGEISLHEAAAVADLSPKAQDAHLTERKTAPKPDHPATVTWEKFADLQEKYDALAEHCEDLTDELKTSVALMGTDAAIEMQKLREELRLCVRRRDQLMTTTHGMQKQVEWWKKQAVKLGYKSKK